jgi:CheY-like chemotaxis protein
MQFDILNILQTLLLPLAAGAVVVAGLLVWLAGRQPAPRPAPRPAPAAQPTRQDGSPPPQDDTQAADADPAATGANAAAPQADLVPADTAPATPAPTIAALRPLRADLLLVDDSAVVRAKLRRLFEPAGYRVDLARDGEDALLMLAQGRYALMITDLEMPRLDGVALVRATVADPACAGMPILAITGHDDLQAQLSALQAVAGIYRKPWFDEDLLAQVKALAAPSLANAEPSLET